MFRKTLFFFLILFTASSQLARAGFIPPVALAEIPACFSIGGGSLLKLNGTGWSSSFPRVFTLLHSNGGRMAVLSCNVTSVTIDSITIYNAVCRTPAHDLLTGVGVEAYVGGHNYTLTNIANYDNPTIQSIYPINLALGGGTLLTLYGKCFGDNTTFYKYIQVEPTAPIWRWYSQWRSTEDTKIVVETFEISTHDEAFNLPVTIAWPPSSYFRYNPGANYRYPKITSVTPNPISISGNYITLLGSRFGTHKNFYTWISVDGCGLVYSNTADFVSVADDQIVLLAPTCGQSASSNHDIIIAWATTQYASLVKALNYTTPVVTGTCCTYTCGIIFEGMYFGARSIYSANLDGTAMDYVTVLSDSSIRVEMIQPPWYEGTKTVNNGPGWLQWGSTGSYYVSNINFWCPYANIGP